MLKRANDKCPLTLARRNTCPAGRVTESARHDADADKQEKSSEYLRQTHAYSVFRRVRDGRVYPTHAASFGDIATGAALQVSRATAGQKLSGSSTPTHAASFGERVCGDSTPIYSKD